MTASKTWTDKDHDSVHMFGNMVAAPVFGQGKVEATLKYQAMAMIIQENTLELLVKNLGQRFSNEMICQHSTAVVTSRADKEVSATEMAMIGSWQGCNLHTWV